MEPSVKVIEDNIANPFEMEGQLKLIKGFFSSSKDVYRLKFPYLLIGKQNKLNKLEFSIKYDLTMYKVTLSKKDKTKFYLVPLEKTTDIQKVRFVADNREDRARWFKALNKSQHQNKVEGMSFVLGSEKFPNNETERDSGGDQKKPEFKLGDSMTLT